MKKIYSIKCNNYRKFQNPKILYVFNEILALCIICGKCGSKDKEIIHEEKSIKILEILGLIDNMNEYFKKYGQRKHNSIICNHFHNILRLFNVLPNFLFTTSETMPNYYL